MDSKITTELPNTTRLKRDDWHALPIAHATHHAEANLTGLSDSEAERRLSVFGSNRLRPPKKRSAVIRFALQFHNVLIYVLLGAAAITAALGHWVDSAVIVGVVFINAMIGFIQEGKAEAALEAIRNILSLSATVVRGGRRTTIPAEEVVPGDIVVIQSGDKVPADLRLFSTRELRIDEAALTGESAPVEKATDPVHANAPLGDRTCMAFSGTLVTYGQGSGVVIGTGDSTEIGRISGLLAHVQPLTTRLLMRIGQFGRWLTVVIVAIGATVFGFGILLRGYSASEMFMACVGLAVAAIPEGLPAIITITLAIGVRRMAKRNAIVRRLPAVETLGSVTTICSDKTGTLTRNEMSVRTVVTPRQVVEVSGVGYGPKGEFAVVDNPGGSVALSDVFELARAGLLCNDATITESGGTWVLHGDPTEGALVSLAMKAGLNPTHETATLPRLDALPFESEHRYMATLHRAGDSARIYVKGAPERVMKMCDRQLCGDHHAALDADLWQNRAEEMAGRGERVLAIASSELDPAMRSLDRSEVQGGLTLLGLVGITDPPRDEAIAAIRQCREAGIRVKMITGDHAATARSIGALLGIGDGRHAITGQALDTLTTDELRKKVSEVDVFARVSPEHKLALVKALQAGGQVVAMTGDGVNDAPALKRADVGVAMGVKGTEVAKEAAEIVLADDNFASIAHAVEEGRAVYDNIRKSILFLLPTNAAEAGTIIGAVLFGMMMPITPLQILWINMVTAVTLGLSMAFEPPESGVMKRPPRDPEARLLPGFFVWRILFVASLYAAGTFGLFYYERSTGASIESARTVAVNMLVFFEALYLLNVRYMTAPTLTRAGLFGNPYAFGAAVLVMLLQLAFTYVPPMQQLFHTTPIDDMAWVRIVAVGLTALLIIEMEKLFWNRRSGR